MPRIQLPPPAPDVARTLRRSARIKLPPPSPDVAKALRRRASRIKLPSPSPDIAKAIQASTSEPTGFEPQPWEGTEFEHWTRKWLSEKFIDNPFMDRRDAAHDAYLIYRKVVDKYVRGQHTITTNEQLMAVYVVSVKRMLITKYRQRERRRTLWAHNMHPPRLLVHTY